VDRLKASEIKLSAQLEAHKAEIKDLKKKLAEINENFEVAKAKQEISKMERSRCERMSKSFGIPRRDATKHPWNARRS
jgi:predicted RNase H-like nuclease (RuvC/YqgF family)